jgi:hypothetical protein
VGLAGDLVDPKHIERTHLDAYTAAFIGNALLVVHDDRDIAPGIGNGHESSFRR